MIKNFYPTPKHLVEKMFNKLQDINSIKYILEPSAGKGDILDYIKDNLRGRYECRCIEKDNTLQATLTGKGYAVIDNDFLTYSGLDSFDVILMNPPFDEGDKHLLKAMNILYSGQIVCILNSETIKNPYSNIRKDLVDKLNSLNADIEYIPDAFLDSERKTAVEIAFIYIDMRKDLNKELLEGVETADKIEDTIDYEDKAVVSQKPISNMVEAYNKTIESGMTVLKTYFQNYDKIGSFINILSNDASRHYMSKTDINSVLNSKLNEFVESVRKDYWRRILDIKEVKNRMTESKLKMFYRQIDTQCSYDFTESNIRQFIQNLIDSYQSILTDAVNDIFDLMSAQHSYYNETSKNIHYYNGWKTNKAYYVNKKVIIPIWGLFDSYSQSLKLDYEAELKLNDIDKVMNYFDGLKEYRSIAKSLKVALSLGETRNIKSEYFIISIFKKGTIHLTFRNEDIRRRFNIEAGKKKNWLPPSYGTKHYSEMEVDEKQIVEEFEGINTYNKNFNLVGFVHKPNIKLLEAA